MKNEKELFDVSFDPRNGLEAEGVGDPLVDSAPKTKTYGNLRLRSVPAMAYRIVATHCTQETPRPPGPKPGPQPGPKPGPKPGPTPGPKPGPKPGRKPGSSR